jgi:hypothetical protein
VRGWAGWRWWCALEERREREKRYFRLDDPPRDVVGGPDAEAQRED